MYKFNFKVVSLSSKKIKCCEIKEFDCRDSFFLPPTDGNRVLYFFIMIPPFGLFGIFAARLHVETVVWWPLLFFAAAKHRDNAKANGMNRQSW